MSMSYDLTTPFDATASVSSSTSTSTSSSTSAAAWKALTETLFRDGLILSNADPDRVTPCSSCADLFGGSSHESTTTSTTTSTSSTSTSTCTCTCTKQHPLVLVLVSGSWCAPCRNFTPVLASAYQALLLGNGNGNGNDSTTCSSINNHSDSADSSSSTAAAAAEAAAAALQIVHLSADHDQSSFLSYYAKMPSQWAALPFLDDGEDDRDDLMEELGALALPCLVVFSGVTGKVVCKNAVMEVQAGGKEGFKNLVEKWRTMAEDSYSYMYGSGVTVAAGIPVPADQPVTTTTTTTITDQQPEPEPDSDSNSDDLQLQLHYDIPSPPSLICQYFQTQLLSPNLPAALTAVILRRDNADADPAAQSMVDSYSLRTMEVEGPMEGQGPVEVERWLFRTAAPALPVNSYGSSLGFEAGAVECWEIERDDNKSDNNNNNNNNNISRAIVTIENETGRYVIVFRETIVMERTPDKLGTKVTKTLNLDGVPSLAHAAFTRRWRAESEVIFHALLGTCERKKKDAKE